MEHKSVMAIMCSESANMSSTHTYMYSVHNTPVFVQREKTYQYIKISICICFFKSNIDDNMKNAKLMTTTKVIAPLLVTISLTTALLILLTITFLIRECCIFLGIHYSLFIASSHFSPRQNSETPHREDPSKPPS